MMADIFNYGFTAGGGGLSTFTSGDALALFSNAHTREDGGATQSNYTTADLNEECFRECHRRYARTQLDHKGQLYMCKADTLLLRPVLRKKLASC
jgi:hypothetical protein